MLIGTLKHKDILLEKNVEMMTLKESLLKESLDSIDSEMPKEDTLL